MRTHGRARARERAQNGLPAQGTTQHHRRAPFRTVSRRSGVQSVVGSSGGHARGEGVAISAQGTEFSRGLNFFHGVPVGVQLEVGLPAGCQLVASGSLARKSPVSRRQHQHRPPSSSPRRSALSVRVQRAVRTAEAIPRCDLLRLCSRARPLHGRPAHSQAPARVPPPARPTAPRPAHRLAQRFTGPSPMAAW